jgi:hypothetical protein
MQTEGRVAARVIGWEPEVSTEAGMGRLIALRTEE